PPARHPPRGRLSARRAPRAPPDARRRRHARRGGAGGDPPDGAVRPRALRRTRRLGRPRRRRVRRRHPLRARPRPRARPVLRRRDRGGLGPGRGVGRDRAQARRLPPRPRAGVMGGRPHESDDPRPSLAEEGTTGEAPDGSADVSEPAAPLPLAPSPRRGEGGASSFLASAPNLGHLWARLLVDELVRNGVSAFFVGPGSRSTPLAVAVAEHPRAEVTVHVDERGGAFAALGWARATGRPAALVTTSGTAVANATPAAA